MESKVIDYFVVSGTSPRALEKTVKEYLREGWQPQGGVATSAINEDKRNYYQALVRYE